MESPRRGKPGKAENKHMSVLTFHTELYKEKAIRQAIAAFSQAAKFSYARKGKSIKVKVAAEGDALERMILLDEFRNYVLGMTKKCY